jgi:hypothetical protein
LEIITNGQTVLKYLNATGGDVHICKCFWLEIVVYFMQPLSLNSPNVNTYQKCPQFQIKGGKVPYAHHPFSFTDGILPKSEIEN